MMTSAFAITTPSGIYFAGFAADDSVKWTASPDEAWTSGYEKLAQAQASLLIAQGYMAQRKVVPFENHKELGKW